MKIEQSKINELCLPFNKRPKKIIGAKVVALEQLKSKGGTIIEKGEVCTIWQSFRGYGIQVEDPEGVRRSITRVSRWDVRFLREGIEV